MIDYLLRFDGEVEALAALPDLRVAPEGIDGAPLPERWSDTILPVALVTADAVYGEPVDDVPSVISPRETVPGFFLLTTETGQVGQVAAIMRETGQIIAGDEGLAGARLDPAWAGGAAVLTAPAPDMPSLLAYAADRRWQIETGGIRVGDVPIATDDRAKLMIIGSRVAAAADPDWSTEWLAEDGETYSVDAAAMILIADAVQAHVNRVFTAFAGIRTAILAGSITSTPAVDDAFAASLL